MVKFTLAMMALAFSMAYAQDNINLDSIDFSSASNDFGFSTKT
jgi:hypothetical protein